MNKYSSSVVNLLTYIEEVEKLKRKPAYVVPTDFFVALQSDLKGLPDLRVNMHEAEGDVWLRIPRMQELAVPPLPVQLVGWVDLSKSVDKSPTIKEVLTVIAGNSQVREEKLEDHPEVRALFDWYVEYNWEPWHSVEKIRRKAISFYNKLFNLYQTLTSDGAENPIELVWGVGMASWKRPGAASRVEHPLLTQSCEVRLDPKTFALDIYPREVDSKIELDCYAEMELPGALHLESLWKEMQAKQVTPLSPFVSDTYEGILKAAVAQLDPGGKYEVCTDDLLISSDVQSICITNTWVIFARKRSGDVFLEDIRRLKKKIEDGADLPDVIQEFVREGDSEVRTNPEVAFRGLSCSAEGHGLRELYFPMPYNEEQVSIIRKLEANNGVVVQGPPGTGKTHTIANVICHYLALGKRVLVTSKGETALAVLQEKLPERIRPLSVALLSDEKDGMRQFEHSIEQIASQVSALSPDRLQANINNLEQHLGQLHAKISAVDQSIARDAAQNMQKYTFHGATIMPEELAKLVLAQVEDHQWFDDVLPEAGAENPPLTDGDAILLRAARLTVKDSLEYVEANLPLASTLPSWDALAVLRRDIVLAKAIDDQVENGVVYALKDSSFETFELAAALRSYLVEYLALHSKVVSKNRALLQRLRETDQEDTLLVSLLAIKSKVEQLEEQRKQMVAYAVSVPEAAELNPDFMEALERMVAGKSAFTLPFGKGLARQLVAAVKVAGSVPMKNQWSLVQGAMKWRQTSRTDLARYASMAAEFGLAGDTIVSLDVGVKGTHDQMCFIGQVYELVYTFERALFSRIEGVFGARVANQLGEEPSAALPSVIASLQAHLDKGRLGYAMGKVSEFMILFDEKNGAITSQLKFFLQFRLSDTLLNENLLQNDWTAMVDKLTSLNGLQRQFEVINHCCAKLIKAGAVKWAYRLKTEPPTQDLDSVLPNTWRDAWSWRLAFGLLERIDVHSKLRLRFEERRALTINLTRTYQELVAERTWLGVYNNSPPIIRQALQGYLTSIQSMGSGTGIRAMRHRRNARHAMSKAYLAVPCWVLPQWRISEALPAELGLFDLVVVDEASQSDIWAMPALMRGKKLLIVGDHKQVSPSIVGMAEQKILDIQSRFLTEQPHGRHMTPDSSIYDLARVIFAGNSVMLKEHFRCVSAIIEYSNREFYENSIIPLRVPKSNERLDPPLVNVFVKGGYRKGDTNPVEAKAIVDEIKIILEDDSLTGRTIGVVTLLGTEQAKLIHDMISRDILPEDVVTRKITVGPPPMFQGRERDIMMVSMVLQPGDKTAANTLGQQQRFNVALSRARDRTYLFRSVLDDAFPPESLSGRLLRHFRMPFTQNQKAIGARRDLCESGFELEMFEELTRCGYRVRPQVPCGGYRIDFVVEGMEGRRLAVECDGDRYHGPSQWADDMARQRVLERAGWVFWRCFASSFVRRRKAVLDDLFSTLAQLGIEPLEDDTQEDVDHWVLMKEVDPMNVDCLDEQEEQV